MKKYNMLTEENIMSVVLSYVVNNIPTIKELLKDKGDLKDHLVSCYKRALKQWNPDNYICKSLASHKYAYLKDFCDYLDKPEVFGNGQLMELWAKELSKDALTRNYILQHKTEEVYSVACDNNSLLNKIYGLVSNKNTLIKRGLISHKFVKGYIRRSCTIGKEINISFWDDNNSYKYSLADFVIGSVNKDVNKFILYSSAQSGKTFELRNLCWDLQNSGIYMPVSYEVKTSHDLKQEDIPNFRFINGKEIVIIIDGLDEVNGKERDVLLRMIGSYAHDNPDIKMVLSCRSNYRRDDVMGAFQPLYLNDLSLQDVKEHIDKNLGNNTLLKEIKNKNIEEYIWNPFFLNVLIDAYRNNKLLPKNRGDIYELFFRKSYKIEKENKVTLDSYQYTFEQSEKLLERVALAMSLMNNQYLTEEQFEKCLGNDRNKISECKRYSIINFENNRYYFTNSALREWLVAKYLFRKDIDIVEMLSVNSKGKVKPEWYNIIILWISMFHNQYKDKILPVIEWLKTSCIELVIYSEKEFISEDVRNELFKEILLEYKSLGIMFANVYSNEHHYLMDFGQSLDTVNFMIQELKGENVRSAYYADLICLCNELNWTLLKIQDEATFNKLIEVLNNKILEQISQNDYAGLHFTYIENDFFAKDEYAESFYNMVKDCNNHDVITTMMRLIKRTKSGDKYIDYILAKESCVKDQYNGSFMTVVCRYYVYDALYTVTSLDAVKRILLKDFGDPYCIQSTDWNSYHRMISRCLELSEGFVKAGDKELPSIIEDFYIKHFSVPLIPYERDINAGNLLCDFIKFFKETGIDLQLKNDFDSTVRDIVSEHDYVKIRLLFAKTALWMTPEILDGYYDNLDDKSLTDRDMSYWFMQCPKENIAEEARLRHNILFPQTEAYKKIRLKKEHDFNSFKEFEEFKSQVLALIDSGVNYRRLRDRLYEEGTLSVFVFDFFMLFRCDDGNINFEEAKTNIRARDFYDSFFMMEIAKMLVSGDNGVLIDEDSKNRCLITAKYILEYHDKVKIYRIHIAYALKLIMLGYVDLDDKILVKYLSFYNVYIEKTDEANFREATTFFDYLKEHTSSDILSEAIIKNLEELKIYKFVGPVCSFAEYIIKKRIEKGYNVLLEYIGCNELVSVAICDLMLSAGVKVDEIKALSEKMDISKKLDVYSSMEMTEYIDKDWLRKKIEHEYRKCTDNDFDKAIKLLLKLGSEEALKYVSGHDDILKVNIDYTFNYTSVYDIEMLVDVLQKVYGRRDYYDSTGDSILKSLENIAMQNKNSYLKVRENLKSLVSKDEKFIHINNFIKKIENEDINEFTNIDDVVSLIDMCDANTTY